MFRVASTTASAVFSILYATGLMKNGTNTTAIDAVVAQRSQCDWYTPDMGLLDELTCEAIDLRRATGSDLYGALDKAERCARETGETCVLSHEVGFTVPAVFVYNATLARMRTILVPNIDREHAALQNKSRVLVGDPLAEVMQSSDPRTREYVFAKSVHIKYLSNAGGLGFRDETDTIEETEAYCVQLLNATLTDACKTEFMM